MTFGAAGDTTVVRTFPYGVPEGADSLVRLPVLRSLAAYPLLSVSGIRC